MRKVLLTTSALLFAGASALAQEGVWRLVPEGETIVAGDCVVAEGGTAQFQTSGQDDAPQNETAATGCPPGMVPASPVTTGSTDDDSDPTQADDGGDDGATPDDDASEGAQ